MPWRATRPIGVFVVVEGHGRREAAKVFGLTRGIVAKMYAFSLPSGNQRTMPPEKPKPGNCCRSSTLSYARITYRRPSSSIAPSGLFEWSRDEHGYGGGYTVVKDYVRQSLARSRETFVPLAHPLGQAQVDFGEALAEIEGVPQKIHYFCMDLS